MWRNFICIAFINLLFLGALCAQEKRNGVFYKIERSKISESKGIQLEDILANQYHLGVEDDKLLLSFSNANLLERIYGKKNIKLMVRDTNASTQYVLESNALKEIATSQALVFAQANFKHEQQLSRLKLRKEISKILGGTLKDSLHANVIVSSLDEADPNEGRIKTNSVLTRNYSINDFNKLQARINAVFEKEKIVEAENQKELDHLMAKPKRIIDQINSKGYKFEWKIVLDTLEEDVFNPSGWVAEFFGPQKKSFLFFVSGTSIPYAKVKFDTINAHIMNNLPLVDTSTCTNDLLFAAFDAKYGAPFTHSKCNNVTKISCYPTYAPDAYQHSDMKINFPKNVVNDIGGTVKPLVDDLHTKHFTMKHVKIQAYASVEGDSVLNAKLAHDRCLQIVNEFQKLTKDSISYEIETNENWFDFLQDLPQFPTAAQWQLLDRRALRKVINQEENKKWLEPWLDKHRYAHVDMFYSEYIAEGEVLDKVKLAYDSMVTNYTKHPLESEMNIAGMRNFLIHQYRHKKYALEKIVPFFEFKTPRLAIVNVFQQYPLYKKGAQTIQSPFDSILMNALDASVKLYDLSSHNNSNEKGKEVMGGENSSLFVLKTFQTQLLRFSVKLIQDGKMDKNMLSNWKFPASDEFHFFALKSILQHVDETSYGHSHQPYAEKMYKVKDSIHSVQLFDYELKSCGMKIVCKESPQYIKVKTDIIKHIADEKYDKSVSEILWYFFIENQVQMYQVADKKLYDDDFNPIQTLQYFEKLNSHLCSSKKDKLLLACYRNVILYSLKTNQPARVKLYLDKVLGYYASHKELLPQSLVDELLRFVIYFQPELGDKKECMKIVASFLKQVQSKDLSMNSALTQKIDYLNSKSSY